MKKIAVVVGLLGIGVLTGGCESPREDIPSHLERIEYLEENLSSRRLDVDSEFFENSVFVYDDGRSLMDNPEPDTRRGTLYTIVERVESRQPFDYFLLSVRDTELFGHDGDVDQVMIIRYDSDDDEEWTCKLWRYEITDDRLISTLDEHYELSTEAVYLAMTEGKSSYSTVVGKSEWKQLAELCGH